MTNYKSTLKSNIKTVELDDKKVKITCMNKNAGNKVLTTLSQNVSLFGSNDYDIKTGIDGSKDFNVKFDGKKKEAKAKAEVFYDNIIAIINDPSVSQEEPEKSNWQKTKEKVGETVKQAGETAKQALGIQDPTAAPASDPSTPAAPATTGDGSGDGEGGGGNKTIIIAAAAAVVILLVVILVMKRK